MESQMKIAISCVITEENRRSSYYRQGRGISGLRRAVHPRTPGHPSGSPDSLSGSTHWLGRAEFWDMDHPDAASLVLAPCHQMGPLRVRSPIFDQRLASRFGDPHLLRNALRILTAPSAKMYFISLESKVH